MSCAQIVLFFAQFAQNYSRLWCQPILFCSFSRDRPVLPRPVGQATRGGLAAFFCAARQTKNRPAACKGDGTVLYLAGQAGRACTRAQALLSGVTCTARPACSDARSGPRLPSGSRQTAGWHAPGRRGSGGCSGSRWTGSPDTCSYRPPWRRG